MRGFYEAMRGGGSMRLLGEGVYDAMGHGADTPSRGVPWMPYSHMMR